jgi:AcrR family transcriptional regulator
MARHADSARERIIDAAEQVVLESGTRHLTLNAVASSAGVSRGGLLYHFPDKETLLRAMLDRLIERTKERRMRKLAELPEGPAQGVLSHVLSVLDDDPVTRRTMTALLASGAQDPRLLVPAREEYRTFVNELTRDGFRFERAAVIALATDGLRFLEILSISPFTDEERGNIMAEMMSLADDNGRHRI